MFSVEKRGALRAFAQRSALVLGAFLIIGAAEGSAQCVGDCDGNNSVSVSELIRGVNINLGNADVSVCTAMDANGNGEVAVNELIQAVNNNLRGCDFVAPTPTATPEVFDAACALDEDLSELNLIVAIATIPLFPSADLNVHCEDFGTGDLSCVCEVERFDAVNIIGLGDVCIEPFSPCPSRVTDCDGDNGIDVNILADRNIGACSGTANCKTSCETYCDGMGPNYFAQTSTCEDFCLGGDNDGGTCAVDADCPGGSCGGPDGGTEGPICNCVCAETGLGTGTAGGISCGLGVSITVELDEDGVCGNVPPAITLQPLCGELTTGNAEGQLINVGNSTGMTLPTDGDPSVLDGIPGSCDDIRAGSVSEVTMVGHLGFFGSSVGDILTEVVFPCQ